MSDQAMMTVGEVHKATGATRAQLRYWQLRGIISPVVQRHNTRDWRLYTAGQVERVRTLMLLLGDGMTLRGAVARMLIAGASSPAAPAEGMPVAPAVAAG
jgi:DNA-binding transcriptional MerR regulator